MSQRHEHAALELTHHCFAILLLSHFQQRLEPLVANRYQQHAAHSELVYKRLRYFWRSACHEDAVIWSMLW